MQWNSGGWFGGQLGATAWIGVAGILSALLDPVTGAMLLLVFALANGIGLVLWKTRLFSCYLSTQLMIAMAGLGGLAAVYLLDHAGLFEQIQSGGQVSARTTYWIIGLTFSGLMGLFYWRFGRPTGNDK